MTRAGLVLLNAFRGAAPGAEAERLLFVLTREQAQNEAYGSALGLLFSAPRPRLRTDAHPAAGPALRRRRSFRRRDRPASQHLVPRGEHALADDLRARERATRSGRLDLRSSWRRRRRDPAKAPARHGLRAGPSRGIAPVRAVRIWADVVAASAACWPLAGFWRQRIF